MMIKEDIFFLKIHILLILIWNAEGRRDWKNI